MLAAVLLTSIYCQRDFDWSFCVQLKMQDMHGQGSEFLRQGFAYWTYHAKGQKFFVGFAKYWTFWVERQIFLTGLRKNYEIAGRKPKNYQFRKKFQRRRTPLTMYDAGHSIVGHKSKLTRH